MRLGRHERETEMIETEIVESIRSTTGKRETVRESSTRRRAKV